MVVNDFGPVTIPVDSARAAIPGLILIILVHGNQTAITMIISMIRRYFEVIKTYGAAPNALFLVSERIAANVFVITATNKLINQKLRTTTQIMKKKQETKNSESIIAYINGVHLLWEAMVISFSNV